MFGGHKHQTNIPTKKQHTVQSFDEHRQQHVDLPLNVVAFLIAAKLDGEPLKDRDGAEEDLWRVRSGGR